MQNSATNTARSTKGLGRTNGGFRFGLGRNPIKPGALLSLQWQLALEVAKHLKANAAVDAQVFVAVKDPYGQEERHIFPLASSGGIIQLYCPGEHTISGKVVTDVHGNARKVFLQRDGCGEYTFGQDPEGMDWPNISLGETKLSINVPDGLFPRKTPANVCRPTAQQC